jgi:hypothetical protein
MEGSTSHVPNIHEGSERSNEKSIFCREYGSPVLSTSCATSFDTSFDDLGDRVFENNPICPDHPFIPPTIHSEPAAGTGVYFKYVVATKFAPKYTSMRRPS